MPGKVSYLPVYVSHTPHLRAPPACSCTGLAQPRCTDQFPESLPRISATNDKCFTVHVSESLVVSNSCREEKWAGRKAFGWTGFNWASNNSRRWALSLFPVCARAMTNAIFRLKKYFRLLVRRQIWCSCTYWLARSRPVEWLARWDLWNHKTTMRSGVRGFDASALFASWGGFVSVNVFDWDDLGLFSGPAQLHCAPVRGGAWERQLTTQAAGTQMGQFCGLLFSLVSKWWLWDVSANELGNFVLRVNKNNLPNSFDKTRQLFAFARSEKFSSTQDTKTLTDIVKMHFCPFFFLFLGPYGHSGSMAREKLNFCSFRLFQFFSN